jgi:beta-hydroxylase
MLTFLIILASLAALAVAIYFIEPFIYALLFSWILSLFVRNPPYVDVEEEFPEGILLKDNWQTIRNELDEVLKNIENIPKFHEVDGLQKGISAKDGVAWRTFIIKGFNAWLPHNAEQVPETTKLLEQLPRVSLAMFSIIDGGKHIPPHFGFFKSVLRYHLGMLIPEGECYILVGGEKYSWTEGEHVLFDDTYRHEVWNKTSERRVVLFLDVLRDKGLPGPMKKINQWMFKILQNSKKLRSAARNAEVPKDIAG